MGSPEPGGQIGVRAGAAALRGAAVTVLTLAALVWQPAVGTASQEVMKGSGPLSAIYIDDDLACQVQVSGDAAPSFFGGTEPGSCGTFLSLTEGEEVNNPELSFHVFGPTMPENTFVPQADFTPLASGEPPSSQTLTGSGTASEPFVLTTRVTADERLVEAPETFVPVAELVEADTYVTGQDFYVTTIAVHNLSKQPLAGTLYHAGDCSLAGNGSGYGAEGVPSAGAVACTVDPSNNPPARYMALTPLSTSGLPGIGAPSFLESLYTTVWSNVDVAGTQFPDKVEAATNLDNAMGLSWPLSLKGEGSGGEPGETATAVLTTTVTPPSAPVSPCAASPGGPSLTIVSEQGKSSYVVGEAGSVAIVASGPGLTSNPSATHVPISTAAPGTFSVTRSASDACGTTNASFAYTVTRATLASLPPPVLGTSVNVEPVSGEVLVKLPPTGYASLAGPLEALASLATATESLHKGMGFIPLAEARQIPVGSILETTGGVARIATATSTAGKQQFGDFEAGIFKLLQGRKQKGLTELDIIDNHSARQVCATAGKARIAARQLSSKVLGRLSANSHGHFTTRGQYSAATVRGTIWGVRNRCDGTLTRVTRGVLSVRDFRRRKTITLYTGQTYLARAPHS